VVTLEAQGRRALTGDYLRVNVTVKVNVDLDMKRLHSGVLRGNGDDLYVELPLASGLTSAASGMESPSFSYVSSA
jgi:hypothetical protein